MADKKDSLPDSKVKRRFLSPRVKRKAASSIADDQSPRVTNETVIQHREEVLSGARKYIYPLRHSRKRIVAVTVTLFVACVIAFMSYVGVSLYKFQSTSAFMYQITKIIPLPIARIGGTFVSYENYLFELRHYIHYFETQQEVNFSSDQGRAQLLEQRKKSLENVVNYAYIKKIARQKNISVDSGEVDARINLLNEQNKLGNDKRVFEDILKDYWGWSAADFRRTIYQQLLSNKVLKALDTKTQARANAALGEIAAGKDFAEMAKKYSDDSATKDRGGDFGFLVSKTDRNVPAQTIDALFKLKTNEVSGAVDIGYGLEILKNLGVQDGKVKAARIFFAYADISTFLNDYKDKQKAQIFIKVN